MEQANNQPTEKLSPYDERISAMRANYIDAIPHFVEAVNELSEACTTYYAAHYPDIPIETLGRSIRLAIESGAYMLDAQAQNEQIEAHSLTRTALSNTLNALQFYYTTAIEEPSHPRDALASRISTAYITELEDTGVTYFHTGNGAHSTDIIQNIYDTLDVRNDSPEIRRFILSLSGMVRNELDSALILPYPIRPSELFRDLTDGPVTHEIIAMFQEIANRPYSSAIERHLELHRFCTLLGDDDSINDRFRECYSASVAVAPQSLIVVSGNGEADLFRLPAGYTLTGTLSKDDTFSAVNITPTDVREACSSRTPISPTGTHPELCITLDAQQPVYVQNGTRSEDIFLFPQGTQILIPLAIEGQHVYSIPYLEGASMDDEPL